MTLIEKHIIKNNSSLAIKLEELCVLSKLLYNRALYLNRQFYSDHKDLSDSFGKSFPKYIKYEDMYHLIKSEECFKALPCATAQQTLMLLHNNYVSFFKSLKANITSTRPPKYKKDKFIVIFTNIQCRIKNGFIHLPNKLNLPPIKTKVTKNIKQVRIVPTSTGFKIEVVYDKEINNLNLNKESYLSIDLGLNNIMSITSNIPGFRPIIVNGRQAKSFNQFFNKTKAYLQRKLKKNVYTSKRIVNLTAKRNNQIDNFLHHASKYLINLCIANNIGNIVIGYNKEWKQEINLGSKNNQNFVNIPFAKLNEMIQYKALLIGNDVQLVNEAYTSKCSALDLEPIIKHESYIGQRIKRGLFKYSKGFINADINGSLNILRKVIGDGFIKSPTFKRNRLLSPLKINVLKH